MAEWLGRWASNLEIPVRVTLWAVAGFVQLFGCACTQLTDLILAPARWDSQPVKYISLPLKSLRGQ